MIISTMRLSGLIEVSFSTCIPSENSTQTKFLALIEEILKVGDIISLHVVFGTKHSYPYSI